MKQQGAPRALFDGQGLYFSVRQGLYLEDKVFAFLKDKVNFIKQEAKLFELSLAHLSSEPRRTSGIVVYFSFAKRDISLRRPTWRPYFYGDQYGDLPILLRTVDRGVCSLTRNSSVSGPTDKLAE